MLKFTLQFCSLYKVSECECECECECEYEREHEQEHEVTRVLYYFELNGTHRQQRKENIWESRVAPHNLLVPNHIQSWSIGRLAE
jgi:hypothetical protein